MPITFLPWKEEGSILLLILRSCFLFQNCHSVRKRGVMTADPAQGLLSYGPIRIEMPDRSQSSELLGLFTVHPAAVFCCGPHLESRFLSDVDTIILCVCFRRADGSGAASSRCLDSGLLPHHPHHCGKGRHQEANANWGVLTAVLQLCSTSFNKTVKKEKKSPVLFGPVFILLSTQQAQNSKVEKKCHNCDVRVTL